MKAFLFLALGLTGVLAAPASPESDLNARTPACYIRCLPGYSLVTDSVTKKCKCVPSNERTCLRETICIGTQHPVWNPVTKKCTCELNVYENPEKERCLLATSCLEGSHAFWNPVTKKCSCNRNDGEFICKAATTCSPGSTPIWHPETETCVCEKVKKRQEAPPDPKTCPTIRCMAGTIPKWIPKLGHCICEKIPNYCPTIKCSAGYKPVYNPKTKTCFCQPDPTQCVGWVCIAEKRPVYDPKTGKCGCQWIPGLEPGAPTVSRSVEEESAPVEKREPVVISPICRGFYCIAEQRLVYDSVTKQCKCEWIPGLEPGAPTASRSVEEESAPVEERGAPIFHPVCRGIYCIAEQNPVYDPVTKQCVCQWIPGLGPVTVAEREVEKPTPTPYDPLHCYWLKIYCAGGDHHMHYDPKSKTCKCPPVKPVSTRPPIPEHTFVPVEES